MASHLELAAGAGEGGGSGNETGRAIGGRRRGPGQPRRAGVGIWK